MSRFSLSVIAIVLLLGGVLSIDAAAQSRPRVDVRAEAEPMEVTPEETVVFTVTVRGAPASTVQRPEVPDAENLTVQNRTPRSRRTYGTGRADGVAFSWRFRPQGTGEAFIGPVEVVVRGETYRTDEIRIRVAEPRQYPTSPSLKMPSNTGGSAEASAVLDARDLFIRATPSASRVVQNEQVVVEYRLYYRPGVRLRHSRLADAWDAPGFWREELDVASRPIPRTRRANGRSYETIVLKRVALFPTRPGELHVDPLRVEAEAQATLRGRGGGSYRSRFRPVRLASRALSLSVTALPRGAPPSFDGAVGQYGMTVRLDEDTVSVGDPVHLMVQLRGTGNLATLSPPRLEVPAEFESYEPDVEMNIDRTGRRIGGTKTFRFTLVPRANGPHTLPGVRFAYLDPATDRYETLRSDPKRVDVRGRTAAEMVGWTGDGLPVGDVTGPISVSEVEWSAPDPVPLYRQMWVYLVLLVPVGAVIGAVAYRRRSDEPAPMTSEAPEEPPADERLGRARQALQDGASRSDVYQAVERAVHELIRGSVDVHGSLSRRSVLDEALERRNVSEQVRSQLGDVLDACNEARFARSSAGPPPGALINETERLLDRLEDELDDTSDSEWRLDL